MPEATGIPPMAPVSMLIFCCHNLLSVIFNPFLFLPSAISPFLPDSRKAFVLFPVSRAVWCLLRHILEIIKIPLDLDMLLVIHYDAPDQAAYPVGIIFFEQVKLDQLFLLFIQIDIFLCL